MTPWTAAAATDIGTVRKRNEDAFLARSDVGLWVVADGMGGHAAGDVASSLVVDHVTDAIERGLPIEPDARCEAILTSLDCANEAMIRHGRETAKETVGSTVAALLREGQESALVLWCGDSRVYRWRAGGMIQLTRDHTLAEQITASDPALGALMARSQAAHTLTSALGVDEKPRIDSARCPVAPGDRFLLCSDGLTGSVSDDELATLIGGASSEQQAVQILINEALSKGSRDNVTAIIVSIE